MEGILLVGQYMFLKIIKTNLVSPKLKDFEPDFNRVK